MFVGAYQDPSKLPLELPELYSKLDLVIHYTARLHTQGLSVAWDLMIHYTARLHTQGLSVA